MQFGYIVIMDPQLNNILWVLICTVFFLAKFMKLLQKLPLLTFIMVQKLLCKYWDIECHTIIVFTVDRVGEHPIHIGSVHRNWSIVFKTVGYSKIYIHLQSITFSENDYSSCFLDKHIRDLRCIAP